MDINFNSGLFKIKCSVPVLPKALLLGLTTIKKATVLVTSVGMAEPPDLSQLSHIWLQGTGFYVSENHSPYKDTEMNRVKRCCGTRNRRNSNFCPSGTGTACILVPDPETDLDADPTLNGIQK